jgi:hypothetical protein
MFGGKQFDHQRGMKTMALVTLLAMLPSARAGEIEAHYWEQQKTNQAATSPAIVSPPRAPATNHDITEIGIERTPCFGSCPVYTCIVSSDGTVRYQGKAHIEKFGDWEGKIEPEEFHALANYIARSNYICMAEEFTSGRYDSETVYTTFVQRGRRKVIRDYGRSGPPELWALENLIDGVVAGATWRQPSAKKPAK